MTNRIYLLAENVAQAEQAVQLIKAEGVAEANIGVISKDKNIELTELPNPDLTEKSDVVAALQRGSATGAATGLAAGLLAMAFPPSGLVIGGAALLGMTGAGAAVGAWSASLIGVSEQHPLVEDFEKRIENGALLIVSDVSADEDESAAMAKRIGTELALDASRYGTYGET